MILSFGEGVQLLKPFYLAQKIANRIGLSLKKYE